MLNDNKNNKKCGNFPHFLYIIKEVLKILGKAIEYL